MATALTLTEAAQQAYGNLYALWSLGTLAARLELFVDDLLATFPDGNPGGRPVADWLTLIDALQADMTAGGATSAFVDPASMRISASYVYKLCYMTNELQTDAAITGAQAAAVLAAYNSRF